MRVRLLTPDLIALPEQFAQMVATVAELAERFTAFAESTDKRLTRNRTGRGNAQGGRRNAESDVATLKTSTGTLVRSRPGTQGQRDHPQP